MVAPNLLPSVALLKEIKLLSRFTDAELGKLIQLGAGAAYEAHTNIVIEGELSWGLYILLSGSVGIFKANKLSGNVYDVGQLQAGSFFGEMSLVDEHPRSATVQSLTDCQLFYISKDVFNEFLENSPGLRIKFYETCVQTLVLRLRALGDDYVVSQYQLWKNALTKNRSEVA